MEETKGTIKEVIIPDVIRVGDFAVALGLPVSDVIGNLMKNGVFATINELIDFDTASIVAEELGFSLKKEGAAKQVIQTVKSKKVDDRPPVVTIMGHVDHGKTSLLDAIRETKVVEKESGGITQHIGAYQVTMNNRVITFLDTPGHEAFSAMRAHGANLTDIIILVVAADDGVKPQTLEAISLAKSAEVPMIVAVNKIDKPEANVEKTKQELASANVVPEDWGGDTIFVPVSAKSKEGIDKLLEMILLVADLKELKASVDVPATGFVIESKLDPGKGPVATVLIQNGVLSEGDAVQVGSTYGRVKSMEDYRGKKVKTAYPSQPIRMSGLKSVPQVAELLQVFDTDSIAREQATKVLQHRSVKRATVKKIDLEEITAAVKQGEVKELNIVLKADVQGSLDALTDSIEKIKSDEVAAKIVKKGVGEIADSDIAFAESTGSVVFGFKVSISPSAKQSAQRQKVTYSIYDVIYELLDDLKSGLSTLLSPLIKENELAAMKVLKVFMTGKKDIIVGGTVSTGKITKGIRVQVLRDKEVVASGTVDSVRRGKDEIPEAVSGSETGVKLLLDNPKIVKEKDNLRFYSVEEIKRTL